MRHAFNDVISDNEIESIIATIGEERAKYKGMKNFTWSDHIHAELLKRGFDQSLFMKVYGTLVVDFTEEGKIYKKIHSLI